VYYISFLQGGMSGKKIISIIGATGGQGSGVIREVLKQGDWTVRGITRNLDSEPAKNLRSQGVEVIGGDISNKDDLKKLFEGADTVFVNTTSNYETGAEEEVKLGKLIIDVAKEQNVRYVILSSEENAEKISKGTHKVPHFTSKAIIEDYLAQSGIPYTSVQIATYYENFQRGYSPRLNAEGVYEFAFSVAPDSKFPLASVDELGLVVAKILEKREDFFGRKVFVAGDYLTPNEFVAIFSKVWKRPVRFNYIPPDVYSRLPFSRAPEIAEMFDFIHLYGYAGEKVNGRDIFEGKKVCGNLSTFEQWLERSYPNPDQLNNPIYS